MSDSETRRPRPRAFDSDYNQVKRSKKHEQRIAKKFGGRRLPNSGAKRRSKWDNALGDLSGGDTAITARGDVGTAELHIEHKRTDKDSMSLKREWLDKVRGGARDALKEPALVLTFDSPGKKPEDWVLVPLSLLQRLLQMEEIE